MESVATQARVITLNIDGHPVSVPEGTTIAQAAGRLGIRIPTLCHHPALSIPGACRVCIVDVKDMGFHMAACSVKVWPGMEVITNSPAIREARRDIVELILDNHPMDCQTCERDGRCELQNLAYSLGVRERLFEGERKHFEIENSGLSIVRNANKCILCGRCVRVCGEVQGVNNLSQHGRGFHTVVTPAHGDAMDDSVCIQCGQCVAVCPTAAFLEKSHTEAVFKALGDPRKHVVVQTAPAIRATIGESFGLPLGTPATGRMVSALRLLGFDRVFDTVFGADLTIMEESHEFLERVAHGGPLPMLTSCSPGWVSYLEKFYPALIPNASTCRSPMTMTSVLCKTWYSRQTGIPAEDIFTVAVMPCVAKKAEAGRPEHADEQGRPYTDAVLTTRELAWMLKAAGIDFMALSDLPETVVPSRQFDAPLGISTGAGDIFGTTGGVLEATLRTAAALLEPDNPVELEFHTVRAVEGLRVAEVVVGGKTLRVGVANGLVNASTLLDKVVSGEEHFDIIEVMACPGGCIGGGGQPYPPRGMQALDPELLRLRAKALYEEDRSKALRRSHQNPAVQTLYTEFLGEIGGPLAHELLHTTYHAREPRGIK
jgi:NADP-reducing hydrogenase subunit HndD